MITATTTALLLGLRDPKNDRVWSEFYSRYQPLLVRFCQRLGLPPEDAQDAAQEALLAFAEGYRKGQYDQDKGRLRTWLSQITRNKVVDMHRRKARQPASAEPNSKTFVLQGLPDARGVEQIWEAEWRRALVTRSIEAIRTHFEPVTLRAFELYVLEDWPAERVATDLGVSPNAVFKAKRRVLSKMRAVYQQLEAEF